MKKYFLPLTLLFSFFITIHLQAQVNTTANDQVIPYDGIFRPGVNPGYYGGNWNDFYLTDIVGGNPAAGTEGAGVRALRSSLPESIALIFGYRTWEGIYNYYDALGMKDNTLIVGFAHPDHADPVQYCQGSQTDMFANLYEPIFDGGLNGTPINENNYFARYIWDLLETVGDNVKFWEVWNEPGFDYTGARGWLDPGQPGNWWDNNPEPCDYKLQAPIFHFVRTMRIAYQVIKTHSPDDYVVLSGVGYESFLDAVLRNTDNPNGGSPTADYPLGGGAYFDVMGFHSYPHFDGSMRQWNNALGGFEYFRHSDRGIEGFLAKKAVREANLANYGYDGNTYPLKQWMITEYNVPNAAYPEPGNVNVSLFGSYEGARNFIMKSYVAALQEGLIQIHPYQIAERETVANADDSFDQMGFFENLNVVNHFDQTILEQGIGYKTTTAMLFGKTPDAARTAQMNLPATIKGGAFKNQLGEYVYVLWARTDTDMSEAVSASYTFPSGMNVNNLEKRTWDYGETGVVTTIPSSNIFLDGSPTFFTPTANTPEGEITMSCPVDSVNITLSASLAEGGQNYTWTVPTATTTCPLGGLTITQTRGQNNGSFFSIGGDIISYEARDNCGNLVECGFTIGVRSSGGGIGNETTGCHASREGFNFIGGFKGHKYFISLEAMTYQEGLEMAANQGGYLLSINDEAENAHISYWNPNQTFIGLNDVDSEGNAVWDSGEPVTFEIYDNCAWCSGNTNDNDAVEFHPWNGTWNWIPATDVRKIILEIPCSENFDCQCPETNEPVCGEDGTSYLNSCVAECAGEFNYSYGSCGGVIDCSNGATTILQCSDGNPCTINDEETILTATGVVCIPCQGTPVDCSIGTTTVVSCDDGNPNTINDQQTILDCDGSICVPCTGTPTNGGCTAPNSVAGFTVIGEFGGSKYYLSNATSRPTDAQATAESNGGYLAAIGSAAENNFIQQNISEMVYIGLNDATTEGNLQWFNGEALTYNNVNPCNFCSENEADLDYVIMAPWDGAWSFSNFYNSRKYVMEIPCGTTNPQDGITLANCPEVINVEGTAANNYTEVVTWDLPTATTDCPDGGLTITQIAGEVPGSSFSPTPTGYPVVYDFTDACGNTERCLFFIYINPADDVYTCPADITVTATSATGAMVTYDDPTLESFCSANLDNYEVLTGLASGSEFPIGTTTVQLRNLLLGPAAYCQVDEVCSFTVTVLPENGGGGCAGEISGFTTLGEFGDSKYYISNAVARPMDAQFEAANNGGYLAAIGSAAENDFIQQNISQMVYIGLDDYDVEGDLEWINDEPLGYDNIDPCGFCNENSADLDFVIMAPWDGKWSFSSLYNQRLYVMEVPCGGSTGGSAITFDCPSEQTIQLAAGETEVSIFSFVPSAYTSCPEVSIFVEFTIDGGNGEVVTAGSYEMNFLATDACGNSETCVSFIEVLPASGGGGCPSDLSGFTPLGEFGNSAYFLSDDIARPTDAQNVATDNGGNLAVISSQAENDFIWNQISELVYIGLNDYDTEGTLTWVDSSATNYTNFDVCNFCNENEPDMDFVVMHSWNGAWSWSNFYNSRKYVIEIPCSNSLIGADNRNNAAAQSTIEVAEPIGKPSVETLVPNPATEHIFVKINAPQAVEVDVLIYDARGVVVKTERVDLYRGPNTPQLDISDLPAGFYSVYVPQANVQFATGRFVKIRQ